MILATLLLMALAPVASPAQSSAWMLDATYLSVRDGVVRTASSTQIVSSHNRGNSALFTLVDYTGTANSYELNGIKVYDFQIGGGYIFFCGNIPVGGAAVIGSFPLSALSNTSPTTVNYSELSSYKYIGRIEAYSLGTPNEVHLVMLEDNNNNYYPDYYNRVIECDYNYMTGFCSGLQAETALGIVGSPCYATDIVVADTNVLLIVTDGATGIMMKRCAKTSIFTLPQANKIYYYSIPYEPDWQKVVGTYMYDGAFAIANPSHNAFSSWRMHVRVFDLHTMTMKYSQSIKLEDKTTPRTLVYLKEVDSLVLLQHHNYTANYGTETDLVAFKPFATANYQVTARWPSNAVLMGNICNIDSKSLFAVGMLDRFWFFNNYSLAMPSSCRRSTGIECVVGKPVKFIELYSPIAPVIPSDFRYLKMLNFFETLRTTQC